MPGLDVSGLDEANLKELLSSLRLAQRCLDGLAIRIGQRSNELAAKGQCGSADETLKGNGGSAVGSKQARRDARRSETAGEVDGLDDAVATGKTSGDHVDAIARHTNGLSDEERARINFEEVLAKASEMEPDEFNRFLKRLADTARADHGLADHKTKRQNSEFRHWFDHKTGMGRFTGMLDPERYEALTNTIDQHVTALANNSNTPTTKNHNLAAEALVELVLFIGNRDARNRLPSVTVVVDHDTVIHGGHKDSVRQTA